MTINNTIDVKKILYAVLDNFIKEEGTTYLEEDGALEHLQEEYELNNQEVRLINNVLKRVEEENAYL